MIIFSKKYPVLMHVLFTVSMLGIATVFCFILEELTTPESSTHVPLIYVLAVLLISRFTEGYLYGVFAAVAAVVCVILLSSVSKITISFLFILQFLQLYAFFFSELFHSGIIRNQSQNIGWHLPSSSFPFF